MNEGSTSISMELSQEHTNNPLSVMATPAASTMRGFDYCDDPWLNTDHDDFVATRNKVTIGSGKMVWKEEFYLRTTDPSDVGMTIKWERSITDNVTKVFAIDGSDNVSASSFDLNWDKVLLSFSDLNFVNEFKPERLTSAVSLTGQMLRE